VLKARSRECAKNEVGVMNEVSRKKVTQPKRVPGAIKSKSATGSLSSELIEGNKETYHEKF